MAFDAPARTPRILAGTAATLTATVVIDGTATDPTVAGSVLVTDALGVSVASGTPTIAGGASGRLTYTLSAAAVAAPRILTATWSGIVAGGSTITLTTTHEVVGEHLFTEAEARTTDGAALASSTTYPSATIAACRDSVHDAFEQILGFPLGRRWRFEVVDGSGSAEQWLQEQEIAALLSVETRDAGSQTWTAYTQTQIDDIAAYPGGLLVRETLGSWPSGRLNVRIAYLAGESPIPLELRGAALMVARDQLVKSNLPARATSQTDELGTFSLAVAGRQGSWFGIPAADAVLTRRRRRIPGIG